MRVLLLKSISETSLSQLSNLQPLYKEGKAPMVVQGPVARRLTQIIYPVLKPNQDYNPNL